MPYYEEYYIHLNGEQKGPYTLSQLMGLYAKGFIPAETLYWMDGFDQWHPVSDLCGGPLKAWAEKPDKKRVYIFAGIAAAALLLLAYFGPLVRDCWKEVSSQRKFTAEAAYWKARGFVREEMKRKRANLAFERFKAAQIALTSGSDASVALPCTLFPADGGSKRCVWRVALRFDGEQKQWRLLSESQGPAITAR